MQTIIQAVEKHKQLILDAERYLWKNPETGYKEWKTTAYLAEQYRALGYTLVMAEGITGFYTVIDTGRKGPEIMILGELDSIICPTHKDADPETGAVHSCGHNAQSATLLGIAAALKEPHMLDGLCGKIRLCAVPAEELLEIEYRRELIKAGKIRYLGGKCEFLARGYFDGVDIAFMVHTASSFLIRQGAVGMVAKNITYKGKSAHAGGAPHEGINALYAANCGLNAINAIRETFQEKDQIRVHPIVTSGGDMVNAIPENVRLESYVRGADFDAILAANKKVNRALVGAALSIGANIEIVDSPGYAPLNNDPGMIALAKDAFAQILPNETMTESPCKSTGSTDMGDLGCIMPVIHPYCAGSTGTSHGNNYTISDPQKACVDNAKWQLAMLHLLLENDACRAKQILADFQPMFQTSKEYLSFIDSLRDAGDRIEYREDGAMVRI